MTGGHLLSIRDLRIHFLTETAVARAADGVSLTVAPGETLVLIGESGACDDRLDKREGIATR